MDNGLWLLNLSPRVFTLVFSAGKLSSEKGGESLCSRQKGDH